jgi:hypothetical protein
MDRRFETAHLKYAILKMSAFYFDISSAECLKFDSDVSTTLMKITPNLFTAFISRYAGK